MIYCLGFLPSIFFSLRFLIQWIRSEKKHRSHVDVTFWRLSLTGNALLALHYFIQFQFLFFLLQVINGFIAWRNLALLRQTKRSVRSAFYFLLTILVCACIACYLQHYFLAIPFNLFDVPRSLAQQQTIHVPLIWHLIGMGGALLFGVRFWVQWAEAEKNGKSELSQNFWTLSIAGCFLALTYFIRINDWVSVLNYSAPLIPFIRNSILIRKTRKQNF